MAITAELMSITREIAIEMLTHNTRNRRVTTQHYIDTIAKDMLDGNFQTNGEPIVFSEDGTLKDGQHRLMAVVKCGVPVLMLVVRGVDNDTYIYDRGKNRTVGDTLSLAGVELRDRRSTIATAKAVMRLRGIHNPSDQMVKDELLSDLETYEECVQICSSHGKTAGTNTCRATMVMASVYCAIKSGVHIDTLRDFAKTANTGMYSSDNDTSAIVFRNVRISQKKRQEVSGVAGRELASITEQAIHDYVSRNPRRKAYRPREYCYYIKNYLDSVKEESTND